MKSTRILLADDHAIVIEGIRRALENVPGLEIVAEAMDGQQAVELALDAKADVIFMDISMPKLNGIEAAQQILRKNPDSKIIILSMHADKRFVERALKAGVWGYLLKNRAVTEVAAAIQCVINGKIYLSPGITNIVVNEYVNRLCRQEGDGVDGLTPREREVLQKIAEGYSTKEIAASMGVSEKTIDGHRQNLMDKLNIRSVAKLTKFAIREGLTSLDD
ncbi:MAG: response regulator transcription factor [Candidatus Omnitrophota bacterium]